MYSYDGKAQFSAAITPVFSVTWYFRNQSNNILKHQSLLMLKTGVLINIFVETWYDFCSGFLDEYKVERMVFI